MSKDASEQMTSEAHTPSRIQRLLDPFKPARDWIKPREALLRGMAAAAIAYGAVLTAAARQAAPGTQNWTAGDGALVCALVAVGIVLAYAAFEVLDDHFTDAEAAEAERLRSEVSELREEVDEERRRSDRRQQIRNLNRDLNGSCRAIVNEILTSMPDIRAHDVATHVWLCDHQAELFVRRWSFVFREHRGRSGIDWGKGKGVAGWAWKLETPMTEPLMPLHSVHDRGRRAFARLTEEKRFGMTFEEVSRSRPAGYTGIIARLIYATNERGRLLAVFGLDYSGPPDRFAAVDAIISGHSVRAVLGICENRLTDADRQNILWTSIDD